MCITIQEIEENNLSWQNVCEEFEPTKDCHEEVENTESNPDFLGFLWCFPDEEVLQVL